MKLREKNINETKEESQETSAIEIWCENESSNDIIYSLYFLYNIRL